MYVPELGMSRLPKAKRSNVPLWGWLCQPPSGPHLSTRQAASLSHPLRIE